MKPIFVSLLAGLTTFLAYYFLLGGARDKVQIETLSPPLPVVSQPQQQQQQQQHDDDDNGHSGDDSSSAQPKAHIAPTTPATADPEAARIEQLRIKLQPKAILDVDGTFVEHQFLHLHHMKTAGTSMDGLISCAMNRLRREMHYQVPYANIHECSPSHYRNCLSGKDESCQKRIKDAAVMSYCAPLKDLSGFEWQRTADNPVYALTVLRHPVERVWSMYRFQTKRCYKCKTLQQVYADYDAAGGDVYESDMCASQLMNHQTRNLLTQAEGTDEEKVTQAIDDMENYFTMIGLTEDIPATAAIAGMVFPWLAEHVNGTATSCPFPHKNSSPQNNRCGTGNTHWDLPSHPDAETAELIRQHNQLDMQVYEAAVKHFELQKKALGL